jgi:hypothetical protein
MKKSGEYKEKSAGELELAGAREKGGEGMRTIGTKKEKENKKAVRFKN